MTIKEARKKAGLTQDQMSELLEIAKRTIGDWETCKMAPPAYVDKFVIRELDRSSEEKNNK